MSIRILDARHLRFCVSSKRRMDRRNGTVVRMNYFAPARSLDAIAHSLITVK